MKVKVISTALAATLALGAAQAQVPQVAGLGLGMARLMRQNSPKLNGPAVTLATYGARSYPVQRTPAVGRSVLGGDQVAYLERQLDACQQRLRADSTGSVCTAAQLQQLQATQAAIVAAQRKWPMQPYAAEIAFYTAEEARRQAAAH